MYVLINLLSTSFYSFLVQIWVFFGNVALLEHPHQYSVCDPAHQNWMKKSEEMPGVAQENGFSGAYLLCFLRLVKSAAKLCTC